MHDLRSHLLLSCVSTTAVGDGCCLTSGCSGPAGEHLIMAGLYVPLAAEARVVRRREEET